MIVGYARVSTDGQTLDAQEAALKAAGVERVYAEKISGARSDRAQLAKLLKALGEGDTVMSLASIAWPAAPAICSTSSTRSRRPAPRSSRLPTRGLTQPHRMAG
jgi:hypothetical protein